MCFIITPVTSQVQPWTPVCASLYYRDTSSWMSSTSVMSLTKGWVGWDGRTLGAQDKPRTMSCIRMVRKIRSLLPLEKPCSLEPGAFPKELGEQIWNCRWSCSLSSFQQFCCTSDTYWYVSSFPALFWNSKLVKNTHYSCHPVFTHLLNNKKENKKLLVKTHESRT